MEVGSVGSDPDFASTSCVTLIEVCLSLNFILCNSALRALKRIKEEIKPPSTKHSIALIIDVKVMARPILCTLF